MDKIEALNLVTVVKPLVECLASIGDGELIAKHIDASNEKINDKEREPAKAILTLMAKIAREVQAQKQAR